MERQGSAQGAPPALILLLGFIGAGVVGTALGQRSFLEGISYRELIALSVGVAVLVAFLGGHRGAKWGAIGWIATFGLGYRTAPLTPQLKIHPGEVVLWTLLAGLVVAAALPRRGRTFLWLPPWMWGFALFWMWGWAPWLPNTKQWDTQLSEFRCYLLLVPTSVVLANVLSDRRNWRLILVAYYAVSACVGAMGIIEYVFPGVASLLPGFVSSPMPFMSGEGFARASFSFWGGPMATSLCVLAVPLGSLAWRWHPATWMRALTVSAAVALVTAIYIGGYRSLWLVTGCELLLLALLTRRYLLALLACLAAVGAYPFLPTATQDRLFSMRLALEQRPNDRSAEKRWERMHAAIESAVERPLGQGWAMAGWTHNDFAMVAANLGLLAGLYFLGIFVVTLARLWWHVRVSPNPGTQPEIGMALLLCFGASGALMGMDGATTMPHTVMPIWFVWVAAEVWLWQAAAARKGACNGAAHLHPPAYLQLPGERAADAGVRQVGG